MNTITQDSNENTQKNLGSPATANGNITTATQTGVINNLTESDGLDKETMDTIKSCGKPLFVIYRRNDLYDDLMEQFIKGLEQSKIPHTRKAFDQGTDTNIISTWVEENSDAYTGSIYVSDETCAYKHDYNDTERNPEVTTSIDEICDKSSIFYYQNIFNIKDLEHPGK